MNEFFLVVLIFMIITLCGCGNEKTVEQSAPVETKIKQPESELERQDKVASILLKDSFWVMDSENMKYLNDAIARKDVEYLEQLMIEGKVFQVDRDTKVTRFGVAADNNNVLIVFDEGRHTTKTGCTHANNVVDEKKFPKYLEEQRKKKIDLIQESLASTEKYSEIIAAGNLEEIERLSKICLDKTNELKRFRLEPKSDILEQSEMAIEIIFARDFALSSYENFVEYSRKADSRMREYYKNDVDERSKKAEQLRQEFRAKYGY